MKEAVAFIPVVIWNKTAEVVNKYCVKGSPLMVEGRIQTRSWEKDGVRQYKTEVIAEHIQLLGNKEKPAEEKTTEETWLAEDPNAPDQS
jgi:single-strand DNA-binding protein